MGPERVAELLFLEKRRQALSRGKETKIPEDIRRNPLGAFHLLVRSLERDPEFYDAGFDHGTGNGHLDRRVPTVEGEISASVQVKYIGNERRHKKPTRGFKPTSVRVNFYDADASSPDGFLAREEVLLEEVTVQEVSEDTLRTLANLRETVELINR